MSTGPLSFFGLPRNFVFEAGTCTLVRGPSGAGKTALLLALGGLLSEARGQEVPWTETAGPLAGALGRGHGALLFQNPSDGLCTDRVADELALAMEECGVSHGLMVQEMVRWAGMLGLTDHLEVPVGSLSGGFQQRLAMGALLSAGPEVLLIDEALSQLDPQARGYLLCAYDTWRAEHPSGVALVVEHRPALWGRRFDQTLLWHRGAWLRKPPPTDVAVKSFTPVPCQRPEDSTATGGLVVENLVLGRKGTEPWTWSKGLSLTAKPGTIVALVGPNGGGKSTLLQTLAGILPPRGGRVIAPGPAMALQNPELQFGPGLVQDHDPTPVFPDLPRHHSPFALSLGQQRRLSLSMLGNTAQVYLLDEPFYGQDRPTVRAILDWIYDQTRRGAVVVLSCHDLDLAWGLGHQVIHVDRSSWHTPTPPTELSPWWNEAEPWEDPSLEVKA